MLSGLYWPAHPHPFADELLSSWLVRIAHANGLKVQTFCQHEFGLNHQVWNRDIDRLGPEWLLQRLAEKSGLTMKEVWAHTLLPYQGWIYSHHQLSGQLRWILPLHIYHRKRQGFGLQYCPVCLEEDHEPYFRRAWRVALYTFCPKHQILMHDRCPACGHGVVFHRLELGHRQQTEGSKSCFCSECDFDLRQAPTIGMDLWDQQVFATWNTVLHRIETNSTTSHARENGKLDVLHHFCRLLVSKRLARRLYPYLCMQTGQIETTLQIGRLTFEQRLLQERHQIIGLAWWLLQRWPSRILQVHCCHAVRYNELLKDFHHAPGWYREAVKRTLQINM